MSTDKNDGRESHSSAEETKWNAPLGLFCVGMNETADLWWALSCSLDCLRLYTTSHVCVYTPSTSKRKEREREEAALCVSHHPPHSSGEVDSTLPEPKK